MLTAKDCKAIPAASQTEGVPGSSPFYDRRQFRRHRSRPSPASPIRSKPAAARTPPLPARSSPTADAYHWDAAAGTLLPVPKVSRGAARHAQGHRRRARHPARRTSLQFARGYAANNALLWGARGMGKSSLVKAVHGHINGLGEPGLKRLILIEIAREDIEALPQADAAHREGGDARFIVFCDDLSFDKDETSYKSLKTILDGGLEGRPENVLFYATSNRRHLMPRDMVENERSTAITPGEAVDEKVSLSRSLRPLAGLPQLRPADLPGHDPRLLRRVRPQRSTTKPCAPAPSNGP